MLNDVGMAEPKIREQQQPSIRSKTGDDGIQQ